MQPRSKRNQHQNNIYFSRFMNRQLGKAIQDATLKQLIEETSNIIFSYDANLEINENNFNDVNDSLWEKRSKQLIAFLNETKSSNLLSNEIFYQLVDTIKAFVNTVDYSILGKTEKKTFLDFHLVSYTSGFKKFNQVLSDYAQSNEARTSYFNSAKQAFSVFISMLDQGLRYAKDHPYQTMAFVLASQTVLANTYQVEKTPGLVAYYPFTEGSVVDASGNGNDGISYGAKLAPDRFNKVNAALYFDGSSYIRGRFHSAYPKKDITLSLWFKPFYYPLSNNADRGGTLYSHTGDVNNVNDITTNLIAGVNQGVQPACNHTEIKNNYAISDYGTDIFIRCNDDMFRTPMTWNHFAFTSSSRYGMAIYLNGKKLCDNPEFLNAHSAITDFAIGAVNLNRKIINGTCNPFWNGYIDDLMLIKGAYTAAQIAELYEEQWKQPYRISDTLIGAAEGVGGTLLLAAGIGIFCLKKQTAKDSRINFLSGGLRTSNRYIDILKNHCSALNNLVAEDSRVPTPEPEGQLVDVDNLQEVRRNDGGCVKFILSCSNFFSSHCRRRTGENTPLLNNVQVNNDRQGQHAQVNNEMQEQRPNEGAVVQLA